MPYRSAAVTLICISLWLAPNAALADSDALQERVTARIEAMKQLKRHTKLIADMARGRAPFEPQRLQQAAAEIASEAAKFGDYFPPGSLLEPSNALPTVWQQRAKFERLSAELERSARLLANRDAPVDHQLLKQQFRQMGRTCAGCHKHFRQKQEEADG